jgi:LysR family transcriptional regulator, nitrogen assimilation regulatory protein
MIAFRKPEQRWREMDVKQLRYFSAVFERRNLSHAAQACNVAQSAISHHVSNLEAELGIVLFERLPRGMEPTAAASRLYEHAQAILRGLKAAAEDVVQMSESISGEIQVGLPFTIIEAISVSLMCYMRDNYPGARVVIHEALSSHLIRQLLEGEHDLILCYNAPQDDRIKLLKLHEEELCCAGRPEFLGNECSPIDFAEALELPQIMLRRGEASRSLSTQLRLLERLHDHAAFELNSVNGVLKGIAAGLGTAIIPFVTVRDMVAEGTIVARPLVNPRSIRTLYVGRLAERLPTRLMDLVQEKIVSLIREQVEDGSWPTVRREHSDDRPAA